MKYWPIKVWMEVDRKQSEAGNGLQRVCIIIIEININVVPENIQICNYLAEGAQRYCIKRTVISVAILQL